MSDNGKIPAAPACVPSAANYCPPETLPTCDSVGEKGAQFFDELMVIPGKGGESEFVFVGRDEKAPEKALQPTDTDNPKTEGNDSQVNRAVYEGHVAREGYQGLCRGEDGSYFGYMNYGRHMAFRSQTVDLNHMDQREVVIPVHDMEKIVQLLDLGPLDMAIKPGKPPMMKPDGTYAPGAYYFTNNFTRLNQIVSNIENSALYLFAAGVSRESIASLLNHLGEIKKPYDAQMSVAEQQDGMWYKQIFSQLFISIIVSLPLYYVFIKQLKMTGRGLEMTGRGLDNSDEALRLTRKQMEGDSDKNKLENFATDLIASEKKRLAADVVSNEIRGRDSEALEFLRRLSRPRYANPMVVGPSGVGKDKIVERAAQLIALRDPRVPRHFLDGTIKGIYIVDPSAFSANTGIRGDSAARANEIIKAMNAGYAVYFPEIADFLSSGAARDGSSESLASQLKDALTRGTARFAGSTTEGSFQSLVRTIPWLRDIERRMPAMEVKDLHVDVIKDVVPKSMVPFYEDYYNVEIGRDVVDAAINIALKNMPEESHARIDAIDQLVVATIERAVQERRVNGEGVKILAADVFKVMADRTGMSISEIERESRSFEESVSPKSAEDMAMERSFAHSLEEQLKSDTWFSGLDKSKRYDAERVAGSLLLSEGGERFRNADGSVRVKELAREAKAGMSESAASRHAEFAPASGEPQAAGRDAQIEVMRRKLVQEAELAAAGREKPLGFDIRSYTETDQQALAERAFARLSAMSSRQQGEFVDIVDGSSQLKVGAAHKILVEDMSRSKDPRKGLVKELANDVARAERERARGSAERAAEGAKGRSWSRFFRK